MSHRNAVDRFSYADDTQSVLTETMPTTDLTNGMYDMSWTSNSGVAGYQMGGQAGIGIHAVIQKHVFASNVMSNLSATLTDTAYNGSGMENSGVAGYVALGYKPSGYNTPLATIDKLTYATEATAALNSGLSEARSGTGGMGNTGTAGYFAGGQISNQENPTAWRDDADKYAFPSDTRSTLSGLLSKNYSYQTASSNSEVAGYTGTGNIHWATQSDIDKIAYASDTNSTLGTGTSVAGNDKSEMSNQGALA